MGCLKRKFFSKHEADRILLSIKNTSNYKDKERQEQRSYFCRKCGAYHLTSINEKSWEKIKTVNKIKKDKGII